MTDDALFAWIASGAPVVLSDDEAAAKRCQEFSQRFHAAMNPDTDLGATEEEHQLAVARDVFAVHIELNTCGEEEYNAVWSTLSAPVRAAIKKYVAMNSQFPRNPRV